MPKGSSGRFMSIARLCVVMAVVVRRPIRLERLPPIAGSA
jgi:hypothetical protein